MNLKATCKTAPADPPTRRPYCLIKFRAARREVTSSVLYHISTLTLAHVLGIKSYPIPSTLYAYPCTFNYPGNAKTLPIGSAPTIMVLGLFSLNLRAIPAIVPPVPTPTITASTFLSH